MNCRKCGKEIQAGYQFCPFCGAKDPVKEEQLVLRNTDWLRYATEEELASFLKELRIMTAEDFGMWCCGMHENIRIFQIAVKYSRHYEANGKTEWHHHLLRGISAKEAIEKIHSIMISGDRLHEVFAKEYRLTKSVLEEDEGITWFRTREECEAAINRLMHTIRGC